MKSANIMAPQKLNTLENPYMPNSLFISMVFQTTSVSSEAALEPGLRLNTLPGHCLVLWFLFRASLLLPSPRLTPAWALWTQQSPAHSLSLGCCRLDLPKGQNSNHITVVQHKVCTFCPETHEKSTWL